ncbi:MAG: TonB-dependent receptor [Alphaproteobacteria bacterium]|nr:TonB-dependent receptor [Alphaproteobacteria bacterium]
MLLAGLSAAAADESVETVVVTASALPGTTLDPDRLPVSTEVLSSDDLSRFGASGMLGALGRSGGGVSLSDAQDNPFQPNLTFRGFQASPLAGDAQGLAVYVDGVRFNQPFGDAVGFDLIPAVAIDTLTVEGSNPVFGLNALGGSISILMKDGFTWHGTELEAAGGSFDRYDLTAQAGVENGAFSLYAAGNVLHETGWRDHSPSRIGQIFVDAGWRKGGAELHLDLIGADTDLTGNGTAPVELLAVDRAAVFTWPDDTRDTYGLANLRGTVAVNDALSVQANAYVSRIRARTLNGDVSDAQVCDDDPEFLCLENDFLTGTNGDPIPNFLNGGTYAQLNRTGTDTTGFGGAVQAQLATGRNKLLAGFAYDAGRTDFTASSEIGAMTLERGFAGPGIVIDQDDGSIAPVHVTGRNDYQGYYLADVFTPFAPLSITASARYNVSRIVLRDENGHALNGRHGYSRLNPAVGATYRMTDGVTAYAGYAQANRAPTPAEFSCADPGAPCSLTNFFVADPDLKQVVAHTVEAGLRGRGDDLLGGAFQWRLGLYTVDADDDILFAASSITGRAFFENIGTTRRRGAELSGEWTRGPWRLAFDYTHTDATFREAFALDSEDNPKADAHGLIHVVPGDRLPGIPADMLKLGIDWHGTPDWTLSLSGRAASGQYLRGDESNLDPKTGAYFVLDAAALYRLSDTLALFGEIDNLLDAKYETFGAFSPTAEVPIVEVPGASNPRSLSPAAPLSVYAGLRVAL